MGWWPVADLRAAIDLNIDSRKGKGFVVVGDDGQQRHIWIDGGTLVYGNAAEADIVCAAVNSKTMRASILKLGELGEAS